MAKVKKTKVSLEEIKSENEMLKGILNMNMDMIISMRNTINARELYIDVLKSNLNLVSVALAISAITIILLTI